jgi:hypothetical protein
MNKVYKNIPEFLMLNFPDSYKASKKIAKFDIQKRLSQNFSFGKATLDL